MCNVYPPRKRIETIYTSFVSLQCVMCILFVPKPSSLIAYWLQRVRAFLVRELDRYLEVGKNGFEKAEKRNKKTHQKWSI